MRKHTVLVAGATGLVGSQIVKLLDMDENWQVLTLARTASKDPNHISTDLLLDDLASKLSLTPNITHLIYCSRAPYNEGKEEVASNLRMLQRLIEAVERHSPALAHIHIVEGGKWYGAHLGPYKTPASEDDPRHDGPNFYHAQEDWLRVRQQSARWTWSASRPSFVCAATPGVGRNMISTLGAYAAICSELGAPFDFPGSMQGFQSLTEITQGELLARAIRFIVTEPRAANQAFNVTNGDWFCWEEVWADIADFFGAACGSTRPFDLVEWATDKTPTWELICARNNLKQTPLHAVADWPFANFFVGQEHDVASSVAKLRSIGFNDKIDSNGEIFSILGDYRRLKLLP